MRKEPFTVENYIHIYNRGNRKQEIVRDAKDKWRFIQALRYFNDEYSPPWRWKLNFLGGSLTSHIFHDDLEWPAEWPEHKPLVKILAFVLMPNHFHLLAKEIQEGGTAKFMQKFGTGVTNYFNTRHKESGALFQGSYKAKLVDEDMYIKNLSVYIQVKNSFELYPGGLGKAIGEFDEAYERTINDPYNSLADYAGKRESPIIDRDILGELFTTPEEYKEFARDAMLARNIDESLGELIFEEP